MDLTRRVGCWWARERGERLDWLTASPGALTAGAGHFHQLEVPGQVNAIIEQFMTINHR